mmetsp:Transcript_1811/g.3578  ORF Transcript_1811/g.3578 Transcript_1811/m.3578 type:complete len:167 (+) Transcript_1811:1448-1948(+)
MLSATALELEKSTVLKAGPGTGGREAEVVVVSIVDRAATAMIGTEENIDITETVPVTTAISTVERKNVEDSTVAEVIAQGTTVFVRLTADATMIDVQAEGATAQAMEALDSTGRHLVAIVALHRHREDERIGIGTEMEEEMIGMAEITGTDADDKTTGNYLFVIRY